MEEQFVSAMELFLGKHLTAIIIIIAGLIGATAFIVWWLTSKYDSMKNKFDNLPCSHHNEKIDSHDNQLTDTRVLLSRMEAQLEILVTNSIEKSNKKIRSKSGSAFSAKHSPRRLNENGISLLEECDGIKFLKDHEGFFLAKIERLNPKTALDVEDMSLAVLQTSTGEDMFIPIKKWVYNAPSIELKELDGTTKLQDIELDDVLFVLSLPLRDKYLETHPDIIK